MIFEFFFHNLAHTIIGKLDRIERKAERIMSVVTDIADGVTTLTSNVTTIAGVIQDENGNILALIADYQASSGTQDDPQLIAIRDGIAAQNVKLGELAVSVQTSDAAIKAALPAIVPPADGTPVTPTENPPA